MFAATRFYAISLIATALLFATTAHAQKQSTAIEPPVSPPGNASCNKFSGPVKAEWLEDGRRMKLLETVTFTDPYCRQWTAPSGAIVDGASIPQLAWSIIGGPFEGKYRDASVIHDVACEEKHAPWEYVHLAFYYAMLASDVDPIKAKVMYAAVYHFGPRWAPPTSTISKPVDGLGGKRSGFGGLGGLVRNKKLEDKQTDSQSSIPVPPSQLKASDFEKLETAIESNETTSHPLSISDIEGFRL